jgi:hypothetical protein
MKAKTPKYLRDMERPMVLGYELDRRTLTPIQCPLPIYTDGRDTGADPIGDGTFRMYPSGDIVNLEERHRRLAR